jgi:hypothetical protein
MASFVTSAHILLPFRSIALNESGTRNALLGLWSNSTEVYLTPFIIGDFGCRKKTMFVKKKQKWEKLIIDLFLDINLSNEI